MRNTTVHLPELYIKLIDEIICEEDYPCLSEFVRIAIRKMLKRDIVLLKNPRIEKTSEKIQEYMAKQKNAELQMKLDQFREILKSKSELENESREEVKRGPKKQTRIEQYWK